MLRKPSCLLLVLSLILSLPMKVLAQNSPTLNNLRGAANQLDAIGQQDSSNIIIPNSDILKNTLFVKPGELCIDLFGGCNGKKKSYRDYLELKVKISQEAKNWSDIANGIDGSISNYKTIIAGDNIYGGTKLGDDLNSLTGKYTAKIANEIDSAGFKTVNIGGFKIGLSLGDVSGKLIDALQGDINLVSSAVKGDIQLAPALVNRVLSVYTGGEISISDSKKLLNNISSSGDVKLENKVKWVVETGNFLVDLTKEINDKKSDLSKLDSSSQLAKMYKITSELVESKTVFSKTAGFLSSWAEIQKKYKELDEINASISELRKLNIIDGYDETYLGYAKLSTIADITSAFASIAQEVVDTEPLSSNPSLKSTKNFLKGVQAYVVPFKKFIDEGASFVQLEDLRLGYRKLLEKRKITEILSSNYKNYANDSYNLVSQYENDRDKLIYQGQLTTSVGCITQLSSSQIGSAFCSFASSTQKDFQDSVNSVDITKNKPIGIQEGSQYTNGQIVRAPLDIGLTWNQSTNLDLDSHLVTPNNEHVFFSERGSLNSAPNAFLYRDSIPDPSVNSSGLRGAEQLRITQFQNGEYRFYIYNYSSSVGEVGTTAAQSAGINGLSNSGATVRLYEGGKPLTDIPNDPNTFNLNDPNVQRVGNPYPGNSTFNVPTNQPGNTWYVFKLDTRTGILQRINRFGNASNSTNVPNIR
jgi:hypothetical protein